MEVIRENGEIQRIIVAGQELYSDDGDVWFLPKNLLSHVTVSDLPSDAEFQPCKYSEKDFVQLDSIPMRIMKVSDSKVLAIFEDSGTRKHWDGLVGFKPYMEAKRDIVKERAEQVGDVAFIEYEDDGAWISLSYSAEFEVQELSTAVELAEQLVDEIEGAAEISLGGSILPASTAQNEREFTLRTVLPIFRKLGFCNVRYNHGKREYGKDVLFARTTEFSDLEHWAAQVKVGDISGGAGSEIDTIVSQADDAFKMPFYDVYTRRKERISKLAIIISGRFSENAIEKICEKIESNALKNSLVFIDGEKLETLSEKLRK